jgi:hypothetical protein
MIREGDEDMVQGWVTTLVLAFGIVVAVIGVIAYLRMFRKDRLSGTAQPAANVSSPKLNIAAKSTDGGHSTEAITEHAGQRD